MPLSVVVLSGKQVGSAVTLPRGAARGFAVACASNGTAAAIFIEFALTSGTAPFQRLQRSDGTGAYVVHSGTGDAVGLVTSPPSPWLRLAVSSDPSSPMSYTILETAL